MVSLKINVDKLIDEDDELKSENNLSSSESELTETESEEESQEESDKESELEINREINGKINNILVNINPEKLGLITEEDIINSIDFTDRLIVFLIIPIVFYCFIHKLFVIYH
jgi:hypothetical protein